MDLKSMVYEVTHPILAMVRSNHWLIKQLFGVKVPAEVDVSFDPTTVALRQAVCDTLTPDDTAVFEMGIGQAALVGLSVAKQCHVELHGADCSTARVESSQRVAEANDVSTRFVVSDLFSSVDAESRYDVIFFNVPYVPSQQGQDLQLTKRLGVDGDQVWDGGPDGTQVLREFLNQAPAFLSPHGRVVFGVQNLFVPDDVVLQVIEDCKYQLVQRSTRRWVPSCCYVVCPAAAR